MKGSEDSVFCERIVKFSESRSFNTKAGLLVGCKLKANCPLMRPGPIGGMPSVGGLYKRS